MRSLMRQAAALVLLLTALIAPAVQSRAEDAPETARKVLVKTTAIYPTLARSMNIHGVVKLEAVIAPNGSVKSIEVKGGHPLLTQSAVTAVGHWKFEPAAHESKETIEIKFDTE